jgi:maltooligosyltrehalose trehalohydrolase
VVFAQNHDQVGNRADGSRLASLVSEHRLRLGAALVALAPGIPLLFMGEEYAETAPFGYFVDHGDPELLDAVRRGRAQEFGRQGADVLDPSDEKVFLRCVLDPVLRHDSERAGGVWELWRSLLALRAAEPALRRADRGATSSHADASVITLTRFHDGVTVVTFFNLSPSDASGVLPPLSRGLAWEELLHPSAGPAAGNDVVLAPWGFRVFRSVRHSAAPS